MEPGMEVKIHGLHKELGYNGMIGHLLEFDSTRECWRVKLRNDTVMELKPTMLILQCGH